MKIWLTLGLGVVAVYLLVKRFGAPNDLQAELKEQEQKQELGRVATAVNNASAPPMSTFTSTPLAGIWADPFNPENPAAQPADLGYMRSILLY